MAAKNFYKDSCRLMQTHSEGHELDFENVLWKEELAWVIWIFLRGCS